MPSHRVERRHPVFHADHVMTFVREQLLEERTNAVCVVGDEHTGTPGGMGRLSDHPI
jgi:hypothetical protein